MGRSEDPWCFSESQMEAPRPRATDNGSTKCRRVFWLNSLHLQHVLLTLLQLSCCGRRFQGQPGLPAASPDLGKGREGLPGKAGPPWRLPPRVLSPHRRGRPARPPTSSTPACFHSPLKPPRAPRGH